MSQELLVRFNHNFPFNILFIQSAKFQSGIPHALFRRSVLVSRRWYLAFCRSYFADKSLSVLNYIEYLVSGKDFFESREEAFLAK